MNYLEYIKNLCEIKEESLQQYPIEFIPENDKWRADDKVLHMQGVCCEARL